VVDYGIRERHGSSALSASAKFHVFSQGFALEKVSGSGIQVAAHHRLPTRQKSVASTWDVFRNTNLDLEE
jgi:hypothetical protein